MKKFHPKQICRLYENSGIERFQRGDYEFAEELFRAAYECTKRDQSSKRRLNAILNNLAVTLFKRGLYEQSERYFQEAIQCIKEQHGIFHPDLSFILSNLAETLYRLEKVDEAQGYEVCAEVLKVHYEGILPDTQLLGLDGPNGHRGDRAWVAEVA